MSLTSIPQPKVAIVYDWVTTPYGGAENVLLGLAKAFPQAPLLTSLYQPHQARWAEKFKVIPSMLNTTPLKGLSHRWAAPFLPMAFETLDTSEFDVIISVTSGPAKGVLTKPNQLHLCYLLTPPRYAYTHRQSYLSEVPGGFLTRPLATLIANYWWWWDQAAQWRPDAVFPISELVASRARTVYQRQIDEVIYPPVEVKAVTKSTTNHGPVVVISRLVKYKQIHMVIEACQLLDQPLVIVGDGPMLPQLKKLAQRKPGLVTFTGAVNDKIRDTWLAQASVLAMPGLEDFGITALEAVSQGVPVVIHEQSGVSELLSGEHEAVKISEVTPQTVAEAVKIARGRQIKLGLVRQNLARYDTTAFGKRWQELVNEYWQRFAQERHV
jgi:glycosyltransferase involved in cell wall biosynthesis